MKLKNFYKKYQDAIELIRGYLVLPYMWYIYLNSGFLI